MLADRALIRDIFPIKDIATISTVPLNRSVLFEYAPTFHTF